MVMFVRGVRGQWQALGATARDHADSPRSRRTVVSSCDSVPLAPMAFLPILRNLAASGKVQRPQATAANHLAAFLSTDLDSGAVYFKPKGFDRQYNSVSAYGKTFATNERANHDKPMTWEMLASCIRLRRRLLLNYAWPLMQNAKCSAYKARTERSTVALEKPSI